LRELANEGYRQRREGVATRGRRGWAQASAPAARVQGLTRERYLPGFTFQDPIARVGSLDAFALNLRLLRTVFDVGFDLHSCRPSGPTEVVTRCVPTSQQRKQVNQCEGRWCRSLASSWSQKDHEACMASCSKHLCADAPREAWGRVPGERNLRVSGVA